MIRVYIENFDKIIIVHLEGYFNIESLNKVEKVWTEQVKKKPKMIAINCNKLYSVDSSAIGLIVKFFNSTMSKKIMLIFYDLNPQIQKLFATAKLNRFFTITTKEEFELQYLIDSIDNQERELIQVV